ncbi:MAG: hypothetical protein ACE5HL_08265 [Terriglobia bacterium]
MKHAVLITLGSLLLLGIQSPENPETALELSAETQQKVEAYLTALENVQHPGGLVALYTHARGLNTITVIGEVTQLFYKDRRAFSQLQSRLEGLRLEGGGEVIEVRPDLSFFFRLADKYGTEDDRKFLTLMRVVYPENSYWKVWFHPMTDYAGLLDLTEINSSGVLEQLVTYLKTEKESPYRKYVQAEFDELVDWLAHETRFGDTREVALREYAKMVKALKGNLTYYSRSESRYSESYFDVKRKYEAIRVGDENLVFEFSGPF